MTVAAACVACDSAVTPALLAYVGTSANGSKPSPKPLPKPLPASGKGTGYLGGGKGGTADYLDSDKTDSESDSSPRLTDPPPVSSKARMGSPLAAPKPLPAVKLTGPSLRERKPAAVPKAEVPPIALKVTSKTKKEPKEKEPKAPKPEPVAGAKRTYTFGPVAIAAQEARRAAKQMKVLTSGANAPAFDISGDVKILPSQSGECLLASLPLVARPLTCPRPRRRGMEAEAHAPRGRDRPAQVGRR